LRQTIYIEDDSRSSLNNDDPKYWVYDDDDFASINLRLAEVYPPSSWDRDRAVILPNIPKGSTKSRAIVRLCYGKFAAPDFVLMLEFRQSYDCAKALHCVAICSRDTSLEEVGRRYPYLAKRAFGQQEASNGYLNLQLTLEPITGGSMTIRPAAMAWKPGVTIDLTFEFRKPQVTLQIEKNAICGKINQPRFEKLIMYDLVSYELKRICGRSPLLWACEKGHFEMVKLLLDSGTDIATANSGKQTPLVIAIEKGHLDIDDLLLATILGVDASPTGDSGQNPARTSRWEAANPHRNGVTHTAFKYVTKTGYTIRIQLLLRSPTAPRQRSQLSGSRRRFPQTRRVKDTPTNKELPEQRVLSEAIARLEMALNNRTPAGQDANQVTPRKKNPLMIFCHEKYNTYIHQ
jgi:hypothetical protein